MTEQQNGIERYSYATVPGEDTSPEEAIGQWRRAAAEAGFVAVGNVEIRKAERRGVLLVEGPVRAVATVPEAADLANWFSYHPPGGPEDIAAYQEIRDAGRVFAETLLRLVPGSRERSNAWHAIREAVMWANAGRACNPITGGEVLPASATRHPQSGNAREAAEDVRRHLHGQRPL